MTGARLASEWQWSEAPLARLRRRRLASDPRVQYAGGIGALVALYYGAAHLGYALEFSGPVAAIVWLPVGVGIGFLFLAGVQFWPGVVVGDLLVNNYSALPLGTAMGQTTGNLLEVVVAAVLLRRLTRGAAPLATVGGVGGTAVALAAGTALSATVGSLSLLAGHVIAARAFGEVWRTWWLGDFSGALLVVPLAVAWYRPLHRGLVRRRSLEAIVCVGSVGVLTTLAFTSGRPKTGLGQSVSAEALVVAVFPALVWSAVRLRERGATLAVAVAAGAAVWATTHDVGPFSSHSLTSSVLKTQLFIAVASFTTLCLAAAVTERETLAERLRASRLRVIEAADSERRRLEHNLHDGAQQRLTALVVRLGLAAERARREPADSEALIQAARTELEVAIDELRDLAHGNHPAVLTQQGLGAAVTRMAERSGVEIESLDLPTHRLEQNVEATAYYVLTEAVANAQKYARSSSIRVGVHASPRSLEVEAADDGIGGAEETPGSGLEGLRDRVEALGGTFEVHSTPAQGTRITARIPLEAQAWSTRSILSSEPSPEFP
jgi:signal transduction histidine kinase